MGNALEPPKSPAFTLRLSWQGLVLTFGDLINDMLKISDLYAVDLVILYKLQHLIFLTIPCNSLVYLLSVPHFCIQKCPRIGSLLWALGVVGSARLRGWLAGLGKASRSPAALLILTAPGDRKCLWDEQEHTFSKLFRYRLHLFPLTASFCRGAELPSYLAWVTASLFS